MLRTLVLLACLAGPAAAGTLRVAAWDVGLARGGAGVLLGELAKPPSPQIAAVAAVLQSVRPDVVLLSGVDDDHQGMALAALATMLAAGPDGIAYPHRFRAAVNAGEPSGFDLDGNGKRTDWADGWGWGRFPGNGGMALLSRLPIDAAAAHTFRLLRWHDLPGALLPTRADGTPYPDAASAAELRLSSRSHWDVPVTLPGGGTLHLLASAPTPPLFDGAEGFNRRRNHDEIGFWTAWLGGAVFPDDGGQPASAPARDFVVLGNLNADPADGAGLRDGIAGLIASPRLQDPRPTSDGGRAAASPGHAGAPELDTADWDEAGPGNLRVDYVLPSSDLAVAGAGVFWPAPGAPLAEAVAAASPHRLVWVDLSLP
ncbi:MAG: endonuclease/exonuclease/phosphatase family protein [Amaricoccus sp.]|uniref:endonuclease/exonuclease/phosphatase family protein n=1 Tax=Amaricoccus sp. TaxID=1872485 RepID=UPI0039E42C68